MKTNKLKKLLVPLLHLLFWIVSINIWNVVLNPTVESTKFIRGIPDYWLIIVLVTCVYFVYCFLPCIWLFRRVPKKAKLIVTSVFIVVTLFIIFLSIYPKTFNVDFSDLAHFFIYYFMYVVIFHLTIAGSVYFNLDFLMPRLLNKSRFGFYMISFVALAVLASLTGYALFDYFLDPIFPKLYYISYFKAWEILIIVFSYMIFTTIISLVGQYTKMLIMNREKAQNELKNLKAQINPHFLFNNLNTIYSLASRNDVHTQDVVLQLSDFLRYVLYDTTSETIALEKEAEMIKTYINLQKERVDPKLTPITFTVEGVMGNTQISPLLLLPLIENCFKHGIGNKPGKIIITINFDGKLLRFKTENTIALREKAEGEKNGGIGISNVEKRLNLLYPDRHSFHFEKADGIFKVELTIDLHKINSGSH